MKPTIFFLVPRLGLGGLELFLFRLIPLLSTHYKIIIVSLDSSDILTNIFQHKNIEVINLNLFTFFSLVPALKKINYLLKEYNPFVIHSFLYPSDIFTIFLKLILRVKIPIFWSLRTSGLPKKSKLSSKLNLLVVVIFSYLIPHKIVSCSKEASDSHIKLGYTSKNHIVISNFPDDWSVNSKSNSQLLKEKKLNKIKIGIAARFTNGKSQELMLQLLKYYVDSGDTTIYLSFCGQDTNVNGKLFELTKNLYPTILNRCEFLGNLFGDEYSNWHQNIDIFCLPSITEGVPNAFLEACSLGTPVIGTRLEPTLKMCDNTVLIDKGNLNIFSLKEKINFWLNLELPNRIKISDENQSRCERFFNKREIISNYINLYKI